MQTKVYNVKGEEVGKVTLSDEVFKAEYNEALIHQAVVCYLANQRQGTKSTLTRSEVAGGGKKPWRQKGTGKARQGSIRSPQWIHGGVVFAPKPRDFEKKLNVQMRRGAFISALSTMMKEGAIKVVNNVTVVTNGVSDVALRAFSNLPKVEVTTANLLNTYELVVSDYILITEDAIKAVEEGVK